MWRRCQHRHVSADHLLGAVAKQPLRRLIERRDDSSGVDRHQSIGRGVEDRSGPRLLVGRLANHRLQMAGHGAEGRFQLSYFADTTDEFHFRVQVSAGDVVRRLGQPSERRSDPASDPEGVVNLNASSATSASFSAINTIYVSVKDGKGQSLAEYLENADNDFIKISKTDNLNQFGIYEVTAIEDYGDAKYKKLTVTPRGTNGTLTVGDKYFVANYSALYDQDFSDDSVTEFSDVTDAGSGQIITQAERNALNSLNANALVHADIVDNVTSTATDVPLSAAQGKILKDLIDAINTLLLSDNVDLDSLQEVVDFIEANRESLNSLSISSISGLQAALNLKQNAEAGKGLSEEDFTTVLKTKLEGITASADPNVNADWSETNASSDSFIENKPTDLTNLGIHSVTELNDVTSAGSGAIITGDERVKLTGISPNAEVNVQADWNESNSSSDAFIANKPTLAPSDAEANVQADWNEADNASDSFIQNKPTVVEEARTITVQGTTDEIEVTPDTAQDLSADRTVTIGLPDDVTVSGDLTVNETIRLANAQTTTPAFDNGLYYSTEDGHDVLHFRYHGHDLSIDHLTENIPTGILNGGILSTNTNTTFDISAGDGVINILNKGAADPHPEIKKVAWAAQTGVAHTLGDANNTDQLNTWVYIDSSGNIQQTLTIPSPSLWRNNIVLGSIIHSENVIRFVKTFPRTAYSNGNTVSEFIEVFGPLKKSGHLITANTTNTMRIDRSAGVSFGLGRNYQTDAEEPNLVSDGASTPVFHRYSSKSGGFTKDDGTAGAGYADIDPTKYDNSGTLVTVSGGNFSVQRLYHFPNNTNVIVAYYGKNQYSSIDEAEKNYLLEDFQEAENTASQAIYLGALIVKGNATDLTDSGQAKILVGGIFRSLSATNLGGVASDASLDDLTDVTVSAPQNGEVLKYNSSTGLFENATDEGGIDLTDLSVGTEGTASGDGSIGYDNATGVFTYTPPDLSSYLTSAIDGSGTAGKLPKFSDTDTLTDSVISESGEEVIIAATGAKHVPDGDTSQRPDPAVPGMFRYNTDDNQFEGYTTEWGTIAGSSGGTGEIVKKTFNGGVSAYVLDDTIADIDNVQVFVDGVYQYPSNYTVSGNTVTFVTGSTPNSGTNNVHIVHNVTVPTLTEGAAMSTSANLVGDGSTTSFALGGSPRSSEHMMVFLNGVYQEKTTYTLSGSNINFNDAPPSGYTIEVKYITGTLDLTDVGEIVLNELTGDGTATYALSAAPASENYTNVYIEGVYQEKSTYSVSGSNITFDTNVPSGYSIEVSTHKTMPASSITQTTFETDTFTANGSTNNFVLVNGSPSSKSLTMVFIQGVYQAKSNYNLVSGEIQFTAGTPAEDDVIEVISMSAINTAGSPVTSVNGEVGAVTVASKHNVSVISTDTTAAANTLYVFTASLTLTLPASPSIGDSIKISNRSNVATCVLGRNGNNILGDASDLTLDTPSASFELVYTDTTNGWVIIGQ